MKQIKTNWAALFTIAATFGITNLSAQESLTITVKNGLGIERNEVVAITSKSLIGFLKGKKESDIRVKNANGQTEPLQWLTKFVMAI